MKKWIHAATNLKSYDIQDLETEKWYVVEALSPKKAAEKLAGKPVTKTKEYSDALYYVYETGTQSDKYKMYTGHYGPVSYYSV